MPAQIDAARRALILVENVSVPEDRRVWPECLALRRAGWELTVVCPRGPVRDREPFELREGVEIYRYAATRSSGGVRGYLREYAVAFVQTRRIVKRLARTRRFDVVQACNPPDVLLLAALPLRRRGASFIFDHHDLVPELYLTRFGRGPLLRIALAMEKVAYRLADVVIATNLSFRQTALGRGGKLPEDVFVVRNGPSLEHFSPRPPDPALKRDGRHLIAYVGIMGAQDGVDHAIRALAALAERRDDWRAIFVGEGDALPELRALTERLGLSARVGFPGFVTDKSELTRILASADVCLAPEPRNALNDKSTMIKIAEYMAMGRPVVAYDLPESQFSAGGAAAYGHGNDPRTLAEAIDTLLDDPRRREEMGRTGRARVIDALAWEHSERVLLAAYERAVAKRQARRRLHGAPMPEPIATPQRAT